MKNKKTVHFSINIINKLRIILIMKIIIIKN